MKKGFTLVEMLVVIGIIVILLGASIGGFSKMTKSAERAKARELVSNVATALTVMFQTEGCWPARLRQNNGNGKLDNDRAYALVAKKKYMTLTVENGQLAGQDRFGIVTPWATTVIKRKGVSASESDMVSGSSTIRDHILRYAVDLDGDGITIISAEEGGEGVKVRATACVWCCDKNGKVGTVGKVGRNNNGIFSYSDGQIVK